MERVNIMSYWARSPMPREQICLFAPTLDETIGEDHPVRLLDEILSQCDWSTWEAEYDGRQGQPPIHPRVVAGAILYGMSRGIRSSRALEYTLSHNIDFMWLASGHSIDHSTICSFRKRFRQPLKDLFRNLNQIAMTMGLILLKQVATDGTRVKANNGRSRTMTAAGLEEQLAKLDEVIEDLFQQVEATDAAEAELFDTGRSAQHLPAELADLKDRQKQLQAALAKVQAFDKARKRDGVDPHKKPAQLPMTDPDSRVLPNKEGGYAPNYTPTATTDTESGFILDTDVIDNTSEHLTIVPSVDRIQESLGEYPDSMLADGVYATGDNMTELEERGIEFFSPVTTSQPQPPALRDDPTEPVPESEWDALPRNPQTKKLDKSAFLYDEDADVYYCPMGKPLTYEQRKSKDKADGTRSYSRQYRCADCANCPLATACRKENAKKGRSVMRDEHEKQRQQMAAKMARPESKEIYARRFHAAETPFGILKRVMQFRQFLLRGLDNVKTEWLWACTSFNLIKLAREVARLRAHRSEQAAIAQY